MQLEGRILKTPAREQKRTIHSAGIPRYERSFETEGAQVFPQETILPFSSHEEVIAHSSLSEGSKQLLEGLLRLSTPKTFPGGGLGLEYASLLKTATRPDILQVHLKETATHLREKRVDLLLVPGMSGYPYGTMLSYESGIPAVFLKKEPYVGQKNVPPGSFLIPSYTGEGETLISPDSEALIQTLESILTRKNQEPSDVVTLTIAGADDIIDKGIMCIALAEQGASLLQPALEQYQKKRNATRKITPVFATFVTPLKKGYNESGRTLSERLGFEPFAGLTISSLQEDPPAIGIQGIGVLQCNPSLRPVQ